MISSVPVIMASRVQTKYKWEPQKEGEKVRERLKMEGEKLKESVKSYTGKAEYQFGDLTKATWARLFPGGEDTKEQGKDKVE